MKLKTIIGMLSADILLEVIGAVVVVGWFLWIMFEGGAAQLFEGWAQTICG